jgi:hypothetical protein
MQEFETCDPICKNYIVESDMQDVHCCMIDYCRVL